MFAAIDNGSISGAVYGVGATEEAAIADARRASGDSTAEFRVVPITSDAADYVLNSANGGAPSSELVVTSSGVTLDRD